MFRAVLPLFLVPVATLSAPALKDKEAYYYPTTVGAKWVYECRVQDVDFEEAGEVTRVEREDGRLLVTVGNKRTGNDPAEVVEVSNKGLVWQQVGQAGSNYSRLPILKLPAKAGNAWEQEPGGPTRSITHYTIAAEADEVEVPAGKFVAVRVDTTQSPGKDGAIISYWYARGVGVVKWARTDIGSIHFGVLKSFEPGK
jgi:hypothetical protein